ncbi:myosin-13-like isoform X2 [Xenia sp. Carnegie-2017]|uniref:myosin-13-like isoform X2 n=1 Tax=Xenia sp. Carnegie-2017 TaxID=2897299 RepID=UPI001F042CAF|nr:myosin-13-like isoform X2 [Xenia sp. Carnegie-2017]XP_046855298.1 myosin-13-like isoform X2 [Xenia sp. Carnegie-2017]
MNAKIVPASLLTKKHEDDKRRLELQLSTMKQLSRQNSAMLLQLSRENRILKEKLEKYEEKDRNVPDKCVQVKERPEGQETLQQQALKEIGELQDPTVSGMNGEESYVDDSAVSKYENAKSLTKEGVNGLDTSSNANQIKALQENGRENSNEKPQKETAGESSTNEHDGPSDKVSGLNGEESYVDDSAVSKYENAKSLTKEGVNGLDKSSNANQIKALQENGRENSNEKPQIEIARESSTNEHVGRSEKQENMGINSMYGLANKASVSEKLSSSKECLNEQAEHKHYKINANKAVEPMTSKKLLDRSVEEFPEASLNCSTDKDNSFSKFTSSPTDTTSSKTHKLKDAHKNSTEGPAHETVFKDKNRKSSLFSETFFGTIGKNNSDSPENNP